MARPDSADGPGAELASDRRARHASALQLGLAGAGLTLAALDAYAVVSLLPQMMGSVDLPVDHVEAAAPVLTAFLGGYVVAMPLLGAFSDARGRLPAYATSLAVFAAGSGVTALAPALGWLVVGRALQGLGGGALVPLSLALAGDLYRERGRALAVGAISALQEAGSVVGPVYGAVLAAGLGDWRYVFWLNLPFAIAILASLWFSMRKGSAEVDEVGGRTVDWVGATLLGLGLGLAVTALYPDDPTRQPVNSHVVPMGVAAAVLLGGFAWRLRRRAGGLITEELMRSRALLGVLGANGLAGGALMVALVDLPVVGRGVFGLDTLQSGLLLSRFLLGVPIGAAVGGWQTGRMGFRWTSVLGLVAAGCGFVLMAGWDVHELDGGGPLAWVELLTCGLGFGLVVAPLTTAVLDLAGSRERGLASSLIVLARTLGMVIALAGLTAFGLARFQAIVKARGCGLVAGPGSLQDKMAAYEDCVRGAVLQEYREVFLVAAMLCGLAVLVAMATLPRRSV